MAHKIFCITFLFTRHFHKLNALQHFVRVFHIKNPFFSVIATAPRTTYPYFNFAYSILLNVLLYFALEKQ